MNLLSVRHLRIRPAFMTLAIAFVIALGMFFALADGWAKVEDVTASLRYTAMTPAEIAYEHRENEEVRVFNALWDRAPGSNPAGLKGWDAFPWWPADPEGRIVAVRVPNAELAEPDAANKIACTLLLPPVNFNQQLFREIVVVTDGERTPLSDRLMPELRAALNDQNCVEGRGNPGACLHLINAISRLRNTERLSIALPYDVNKCQGNGHKQHQ